LLRRFLRWWVVQHSRYAPFKAAAPIFVVGNKVKAGLLGRYPSLAPQDLYQGDIKYNVDFRNVYASVLENWLKTKSAPILGKQFAPLPLV
jgi:uncharacterized protein (DUF1501 family)